MKKLLSLPLKLIGKITLGCLVVLFLLLTTLTSTVYGQEAKPRITPTVTRIANPIDHLKENITLFFKFGNSKTDYYMELHNLRLAELQFSVDSQKGDAIESCASRYLTFVGKLKASYLNSHSDSQKEALAKLLTLHLPILNSLRDTYEANSGLWLATQHDVNGATQLLEMIQ